MLAENNVSCQGLVKSVKFVEILTIVLGGKICFNPGVGGPNPNDCNVIGNALLYNTQSQGALFTIPAQADTVVMRYHSCLTFFRNQAKPAIDLQYNRTDWVCEFYLRSRCTTLFS